MIRSLHNRYLLTINHSNFQANFEILLCTTSKTVKYYNNSIINILLCETLLHLIIGSKNINNNNTTLSLTRKTYIFQLLARSALGTRQ